MVASSSLAGPIKEKLQETGQMNRVKSAMKHIKSKKATLVRIDIVTNTYHLYKDYDEGRDDYTYCGGRILPEIWLEQLGNSLFNEGWMPNRKRSVFFKEKEQL